MNSPHPLPQRRARQSITNPNLNAQYLDDPRDSVEESQESDSLSPEPVVVHMHRVRATDIDRVGGHYLDRTEQKEMSDGNGDEEETSDDGMSELDHLTVNEDAEMAKDRQIERLQHRVQDMSAQMLALLENVEELKVRNEDLEASKVSLLTHTAKAMDECRNTVRRLNQQNLYLMGLLSAASAATQSAGR